MKSAEDPETPAKRIRSMKNFPKDQKFEIVGTFEITLSGGMFASSSLTGDRALKYLESFVADSEYDVDAFVDAYSCRTMSGQIANAVGIKFVEE